MYSTRIVFAVVGFVVLIATSGCERLSTEEELASVEQSIVSGDVKTAMLKLKELLRIEPNNARGRWLLGNLYLSVEQAASAEKELRRAMSLGVGRDAALPEIAKAMILQRNYRGVLNLDVEGVVAGRLLAEILAAKSIAATQLGAEPPDEMLGQAKAMFADSAYVQYAVAWRHDASGEKEEALAALTRAVELQPDFAAAWALMGDVQNDIGEHAAAAESYNKALERHRINVPTRVKLGFTYVFLGQFAEAEKEVDFLLKLAPSSARVLHLSGVLAFQRGDIALAQQQLDAAFSVVSDDPMIMQLLAAAEYQLGNVNRALGLAESVYNAKPNSVAARILLSHVLLSVRDGKRVEYLLRPVVAAKPDYVAAKDLLANAYLMQGNAAEAESLLISVVQDSPDSIDAQLKLGASQLAAGSDEAGFASIEGALRQDPANRLANRLLVRGLIGKEKPNSALAAAKEYLAQRPDDPDAMVTLALAHRAIGDEKAANKVFRELLVKDPGNPVATRIMVQAASDDAAAAQLLEESLRHHPNNVDLLVRLAGVRARQGDQKAEIDLLEQAIAADPAALPPRILMADLLLKSGRADKALNYVADIEETANPLLSFIKGEIYYKLSRFSDAKYALQRTVSLRPTAVRAYELLAAVYSKLNDVNSLSVTIEKLRELRPDSEKLILAHARLKGMLGNPAAGMKIIDNSKLSDSNPDVLVARKYLAAIASDADGEVYYARKLQEIVPMAVHVVALSQALRRGGKVFEAEKILADWLNASPNDMLVIAELANLNHATGDQKDQVRYLRMLLAKNQDNPKVLNNLAWALRLTAGDEARRLAARAVSLAPRSAVVLSTHANLLADGGDFDGALEAIDQAIAVAPDDSRYQVDKARFLMKTGQRSEALQLIDGLPSYNLSREIQATVAELRKQLDSP